MGLTVKSKAAVPFPGAGKVPSPPIASNKTGLCKNQIAYQIGLSDTDSVTVTVPIIDKLTFTLPITDPDARADFKQSLLYALKPEQGEQTPYANAQKAKWGQKLYKVNVWLNHSASGQSILIQADPGKSKVAFARFELNPSKLGPAGMDFFRCHLAELLGHQTPWPKIAQTANVTRLDMACDLIGVRVDALAMRASVDGKSHCYFGMSGKLETAYLAVKKGKSGKITAYNKKREMKGKGQLPQYGDEPHTRVEVRVTTKLAMTNLTKLFNPFTKIEIQYLAQDANGMPQHVWAHFTDAVRYRGVDAALSLVPVGQRPTYQSGLDAAPKIWQPDEIWSLWPQVLAASALTEAAAV